MARHASFALEETPLFQSLTSAEIAFVRERVHLQSFGPQTCLLEWGQALPGSYVIRSGPAAVVVQDEAGQEREFARLGRGECADEDAARDALPELRRLLPFLNDP